MQICLRSVVVDWCGGSVWSDRDIIPVWLEGVLPHHTQHIMGCRSSNQRATRWYDCKEYFLMSFPQTPNGKQTETTDMLRHIFSHLFIYFSSWSMDGGCFCLLVIGIRCLIVVWLLLVVDRLSLVGWLLLFGCWMVVIGCCHSSMVVGGWKALPLCHGVDLGLSRRPQPPTTVERLELFGVSPRRNIHGP